MIIQHTRILIAIVFLCQSKQSLSGDPGTSGHDFVFSIPISALEDRGTPRIYFSTTSTQPCPTTITIPSLDFERNVTTSRSMQTSVQLPSSIFPSQGHSYAPSVIVHSSCMVSVYVLVRSSSWAGASFTVFPSTHYGLEYIVLMHEGGGEIFPSYFAISAYKTKTNIRVETTTEEAIDLVLDPYDTYLYEYPGDLTGTFIRANESVSVISGTECARTSPGRACAIILEQIPPVLSNKTTKQAFRFILAPFLGQASPGYVYRIVGASDNSATISVDNELLPSLRKSQWLDRSVSSDQIVSIISDEPVYVVQYMKGSLYHGGGSMVVIPPLVSYGSNTSFSAFNGGDNNINCYINTIIKCEDIQGLTLDDSVPMAQWGMLTSVDRDMCAVRGEIQAGVHSVGHINEAATFLVIFYGVPLSDAFAFSNVVGFNLASRSPRNRSTDHTSSMKTDPFVKTDFRSTVGTPILKSDFLSEGSSGKRSTDRTPIMKTDPYMKTYFRSIDLTSSTTIMMTNFRPTNSTVGTPIVKFDFLSKDWFLVIIVTSSIVVFVLLLVAIAGLIRIFRNGRKSSTKGQESNNVSSVPKDTDFQSYDSYYPAQEDSHYHEIAARTDTDYDDTAGVKLSSSEDYSYAYQESRRPVVASGGRREYANEQ